MNPTAKRVCTYKPDGYTEIAVYEGDTLLGIVERPHRAALWLVYRASDLLHPIHKARSSIKAEAFLRASAP